MMYKYPWWQPVTGLATTESSPSSSSPLLGRTPAANPSVKGTFTVSTSTKLSDTGGLYPLHSNKCPFPVETAHMATNVPFELFFLFLLGVERLTSLKPFPMNGFCSCFRIPITELT